ncbi:MAG: dockerin type I domain-containing protein [Candidatus Gottesmanbacteria bacterium]
MKIKILKIVAIFIVVVIAVVWGLNFIFLDKTQRSKADEVLTLSLDPASVVAANGDDFTVTIKAIPTNTINIQLYKINVNFDRSKVKIKDNGINYVVGQPSSALGGDDNSKISTINGDSGQGVIKLYGEITNPATGLFMNGATELARITFTSKTDSSYTVTNSESSVSKINTDYSITTVPFSNETVEVNSGGPAPTGTPTCQSFSDDFSGTTLNTSNWETFTDAVGSTFDVSGGKLSEFLIESTTGTSMIINGIKKPLRGDFTTEITSISTSANGESGKSFISFSGNVDNTYSFSIGRNGFSDGKIVTGVNGQRQNHDVVLLKNSPVKLKLERIGSTINMYYDLMGGQGYQLARTSNNFNTGEGKIMIGLSNLTPSLAISGIFDNFNQTCTTVPTATPDPSATPGAPGNAKLKMKLKFQGIAGKPTDTLNKMSVRFRLLNKSTGVVTDKKFADFTADDKGVWSGEVSFDVDTAAKYVVYAKGPFHIQKKICDKTPTETAGGTYKCSNGLILFTVGDNNLDFSGILLLAGDLPEQDGTVSAYDTSLVRNCLVPETDAVKATCLANADVNRDGKVDTQDYSLIIASLSVKNDEE